jgi:hypothetical protein
MAEYAAVPVQAPRDDGPGRPLWLYVRRNPGLDDVRIDYYLSNTGPESSQAALARAFAAPGQALQCLADADRFLGLGHYETRSWVGWHYHMSLVALAHWFVTSSRLTAPHNKST